MKLILTNDDGIAAPGLQALCRSLLELNPETVAVLAPESERSASSHHLTLNEPVILRKKAGLFPPGVEAYGASGTPVDCMKIALLSFCDQPDMVVAGINPGANYSTDIIYSGTVAAAFEAALLGVPAMAVSLAEPIDGDGEVEWQFETGAAVAAELLLQTDWQAIPRGTILNVNVPNIPRGELKGYRATKLGRTNFHERYLRRKDPRGNDYFWLNGVMLKGDEDEDSDYIAVSEGFVSVTPLQCDLTDRGTLDAAKGWLGGLLK